MALCKARSQQVTQIAGTNASVAEFVPIVRAAAEVVTVEPPAQEPLSARCGRFSSVEGVLRAFQ